uniref:Zinc transporter 2 n=1 Tax=Ditylenchus dipsaci TaxID=166011 RepID=A0A915DPV4_9BILA
MVHGDENCSLLDDTESQDGDANEIPFGSSQSDPYFNGSERTRNTMEHCHSRLLLQRDDKSAEKVLILVAFLSAIFIILEFTGGLLANSLSIMTDAGHMLSDFLSFVVSIVMIRVSKRPATRRFSFGFVRAEMIGALISVFIIWTLTIVLVIFATQRIWNGHYDVDADTMIVTACLGVVFNIIMGLILKFCNTGGGGHAHCQSSTNVNVRAAFIHVLGDFVQSVGVLVAAVLIKDIVYVLMESTPSSVNYGDVYRDLLDIDGVVQVHSLNIWSLSTEKTAMCVHLVVVENDSGAISITKAADLMLKSKHKLLFTTIQLESLEDVNVDCEYCKPLP